MRQYGQEHLPFLRCRCIQCGPHDKRTIKARKKKARQVAKKEIRNETVKVAEKNDNL